MISPLQDHHENVIATEQAVMFEAFYGPELVGRKLSDLAIGAWSNQYDELVGGQSTQVQFLDAEGRSELDHSLSINAPEFVKAGHGFWVTAYGQGLHYWLSRRRYIAQDVEHGSFLDRRFSLGGMSLNRMILTRDFEERA